MKNVDYLIDEDSVALTQRMLNGRDTLKVYVDNSFSRKEKLYISNFIEETDDIIGVDFAFTNNRYAADIRLSQRYNISGRALGYAQYNNRKWDIVIDRRQSANDKKWTIMHEFGHTLGLEHPFDDLDGDYYKTSDPWCNRGSTSDDSVMSYTKGSYFPSFWTSSDLDALVDIWGTA